jgi:hypothetical protein
MRKTTALRLLILLLTLCFVTCKKSLPPVTQTGAGKFGCYLNGELITPLGGGIGPNIDCYYQHLAAGDSGFVFQVSGADLRNSESIKDVTINVGGIKIIEGMTIPLKSGNDYTSGRGQCTNGRPYVEDIYYSTKNFTGFLHISRFDEVNQIAAGTFAFKAINSFGDSVNITDGRFDMHFTR